MNHDVPVEDAFIDVNVSLRPSTSNARNDFAPHETILSSLGEEGAQNTTFVEVHFEEIGNVKKNGVGPFPVTNGKTHVLSCSEHGLLPGCIDGHKCGELANGENSDLPGKCINMLGEEDDLMEMEAFAFTGGDAGDVGEVEEAQGGKDGIPNDGDKKKDESSASVSKNDQRKRKRYGTEKENDLPKIVDNTKGGKSTDKPSSRKKTSAKTTTKTGTDKKAASSKVRSAAKKSGTKEKIVSSKESKTIAQDVEKLSSKKKPAPSKNIAKGKEAVTMGKKSTSGDNNADIENGEATNMSKAKNKRKIAETNATKKAEKDDTSKSPVLEGETPKKKSKPTKGKVAAEDTEEAVQQAITGKSEKAKVGNSKKKSSDDTEKKSASAKKVIDPNRPKRPSNAFILFSSAVRPKIKKENPELKGSEVVTKLSEIYRATGPDELKPYIDKAGEALAKYKVDMKAYTQMLV